MESRRNQQILLYYRTSSHSLNDYRERVVRGEISDPDYVGFRHDEVMACFSAHLKALGESVSFGILSTLEARFKQDYEERVKNRYKDALSKRFKEIDRRKKKKVSLDRDILSAWKAEYPSLRHIISPFVAALHYRNWFAHGRYRSLETARRYDVASIYIISSHIYESLPFIDVA